MSAPGEKGWIDTGSIKFDSKMKKGMESMKDLFKKVGKFASPVAMAAGSITEMAGGLSIMDGIMQGLKPIFDILNSLMSVFSGAITQALMPAIQPLIDLLPLITPIIQQIGTVIGELIATGLQILLDLFTAFWPILEPLLGLFLDIVELGLIPLQVILEILEPILEELAPVFDLIGDAIGAVSPIIEWLANLISVVLYEGIKAGAYAIAWMIDIVTLGMAGAVAKVNRWVWSMEGTPEEENANIGLAGNFTVPVTGGHRVPVLQTGTESIPRTGLYHLDRGEQVIPEAYSGTTESLLEELLHETRYQTNQNKRNAFFNRRR